MARVESFVFYSSSPLLLMVIFVFWILCVFGIIVGIVLKPILVRKWGNLGESRWQLYDYRPPPGKRARRGILHICHGRHQRNCICLDCLNLIQWFTVEKKQEQKVFGETDNMRQNNWFLSPLWIFCDLILWASNCQRIEKWISHPWRYFLFFEKIFWPMYVATQLCDATYMYVMWQHWVVPSFVIILESWIERGNYCLWREGECREEIIALCEKWKWKEERNGCTVHC